MAILDTLENYNALWLILDTLGVLFDLPFCVFSALMTILDPLGGLCELDKPDKADPMQNFDPKCSDPFLRVLHGFVLYLSCVIVY